MTELRTESYMIRRLEKIMIQTQKVSRNIQAIRPYHKDCRDGISNVKFKILSYDGQEDMIHLDYAIELLGSQVIQKFRIAVLKCGNV